jgi:hypothetical protein
VAVLAVPREVSARAEAAAGADAAGLGSADVNLDTVVLQQFRNLKIRVAKLASAADGVRLPLLLFCSCG